MARAGAPHKNAVPLAVTEEAWLIVLGIVVSIVFVKMDVLAQLAGFFSEFSTMASFIAGVLFTSILTTAPAIVSIAELSAYISPWQLALVGSIGAVCGDLLIFRFIRSPLAEYLIRISARPWMLKLHRMISKSALWWLVPLAGAVMIASPLPDEVGLILMGLSHIRMPAFVVLSYVMNAVGIFLIAVAAQAML